MSKLKLALATAASAVVLPLGVALPAAADYNECVGENNCSPSSETTNNTDNSVDNSVTLGDCAVYNKGDAEQSQSNNSEAEQENKVEDDQKDEASQSNDGNSSSTTGGDNGVNISTDCSTTNVTNVNQAVAGAQVEAPKGGVSAGAGSAVSTLGSLFGLFGSIATAGLGLFVRKD